VRALLDTNAYSALMRGNADVSFQVRKCERVFMSSVVIGELLYGFRNGTRYDDNQTQLTSFLASSYVEFVPVAMATSERFGLVAAQLRRKGRPIPQNDVWIAAHALETGASLLTCDAHFEQIDGLHVCRFRA
jgi:tRNA(fMet)-specific endonuclease VapC